MRFAVIVVSLALAYHYASHKPLRNYFAVNLASAIILELSLTRWPYDSPAYAVIACLCILAILPFELMLMWLSARVLPVWFIFSSLLIAVLLCLGVEPRGLFGWIQAVDGASDLFCAIPTGIAAAYLTETPRRIALSLSFLWLSQALYELGFGLHLDSPAWVTLNEWLPTAITAIGCLWLSFLGHSSLEKSQAT